MGQAYLFFRKRGGPKENFTMIKGGLLYESWKESTIPSSVSVGEDSDERDTDNDLVLCDESKGESESDDDNHIVTIQEGTSTRSGRRVGHWSTRYADFVQWTGTPYRVKGVGVGELLYKVNIWDWVQN